MANEKFFDLPEARNTIEKFFRSLPAPKPGNKVSLAVTEDNNTTYVPAFVVEVLHHEKGPDTYLLSLGRKKARVERDMTAIHAGCLAKSK
jgi:hypothetical protein